MYRYYQKGDELSWIPIPDGDDTEQRAREAGARKLTILSVSEVVDDETTDKNELAYKGPLYFDIDNKDLTQSIASVKQLVGKLRNLDVPDSAIQVYASGSKGFHVIVPASVFSTGRPVKGLPLIYMEMAVALYVPGMDFQVYSIGRGVSWRLLNLRREDGRYRVALRLSDLNDMTAESYALTASSPSDYLHPGVNGSKSPALEVLLQEAKKKVASKPKKTVNPVSVEKLAQFKKSPPACMNELAEYKVKKSTNFNQAALQMVCFISRSGMDTDVADSLLHRMADNSHSSKYDSANVRFTHLNGLLAYTNVNSAKFFACNAMRSVLQNKVCDECALNGREATSDDAQVEIGVLEKPDGYYVLGEKGDRRISTFVIEPTAVYVEQSQNGGTDRRVGTLIDILREGEVLGSMMFNEASWDSKSSFKSELRGISNFSFTGTEDDVQRIKHVVFHEDRDMGEVVQVHAAGIHSHRIGKRDMLVYVEPGYSVNEMRVQGTHIFSGKIAAPPELYHRVVPTKGDKAVTEALRNLLLINSPEVIAQIVGWFCACHLKTQFMRRYVQFPLLSVWGNAGSGKSMTTALMAWLNGCDYSVGHGALNLSSITQWALIHYCSCTTTVPRLLEEYNKSKMKETQYTFSGEIMKAAWNSNVIGRGTISRSSASGRGRTGAEMVELAITSPLVILSEQAPQMAALQQRVIQVMLTSEGKRGRQANFEAASAGREQLARLGKMLMATALTTKVDWVEDQMADTAQYVPESFMERPRYSYQVAITGLRLLSKVCATLEIPLTEEIHGLEVALRDHLDGARVAISQAKSRTEVDAVMHDIGLMITLTSSGTRDWIVSGKHFVVKDGHLFIDLPVVHALYRIFKRSSHEPVVVDDVNQFAVLLRQEAYFVSDRIVMTDLTAARTVYKLSLEAMREKGLDASLFRT